MTIAQMADDLRTMASLVAELGDCVISADSTWNKSVSELHISGPENLVEWASKYEVALDWLPFNVEGCSNAWELYGYFNGVIKVFALATEEEHDRLLYGGADNGQS